MHRLVTSCVGHIWSGILKFTRASVSHQGEGHLQLTIFLPLQSGNSTQSQLTSTGVGMLFSAGTFLYVATVHILPEVSSSSMAAQTASDLQQHEAAEGHQHRPLGLFQSITLILGVGLPVALALGLKDDWGAPQRLHVSVELRPSGQRPRAKEGRDTTLPRLQLSLNTEEKQGPAAQCVTQETRLFTKYRACNPSARRVEQDGWQQIPKLITALRLKTQNQGFLFSEDYFTTLNICFSCPKGTEVKCHKALKLRSRKM